MAVLNPGTQSGATRVVTANAGDVVNIAGNVSLDTTANGGVVVISTASDVTVNVNGEVDGDTGIQLGNSPTADSGHEVNVGLQGSVFGEFAITMNANSSRVVNDGSIVGVISGITFAGGAAGNSTIINRGFVAAQVVPIQLFNSTETVTIRNTGQIIVLKEDGVAIFSSPGTSGAISLFNSGLIDGNVVLGSGSDRYDGSTGRVFGTIAGNAGNDRFTLGTRAERIDGGTDIDTVVIAGRPGARIALDNSFAGSGRAGGDLFANIENAVGSARGNDVISGTNGANLIDGRGGRDRLLGLGGDDTLAGNSGIDRLSGGSGNDTFQFSQAASGDIITDFRNVPGNDDRFLFDDSGFGDLDSGALAASQFVTRASANSGLDADDRIVFRTSDRTLWFDADGSGSTAPVLIADLQSNASVTAADIFLA